jgi:RNA polymerase sigma-70 factor (ECF subfamily)
MPKVIFIGDEERRLVKRLQESDKTAAREFYALYADTMAGVCSRYIADEEDLKDVFQNALVHIFSHITDFKYCGAGSLEAWATKVVVNESLKFLRTKKRHEMLPMDDGVLDEVEEEFPSFNEISSDAIREMLSRLPTGYRTVLNLYVFEGKSHQEIAHLLGIKKDSSASQLLRARKMLAKMIRKYNDDNPPKQ